MNIDQSIDFRSKCEHFRILVIGRANAGKTTLLRKVCRSTEDPRIFSPSGKRRGLHDIENELIFKSNSQFIFHDSRGFESGSVEELDKVKTFLATRAATTDLSKQLHMIWYCLPTDTDRPILEADIQFFDVCGSGSVPVIAIFTKFDGLVTKAYNELRRGGSKIADAKRKGTEIAQQKLQTDFINTLRKLTKFHPSNNVQLGDVQKDETDCSELINITADAITNEGLKLLFVSVQQNNIACCVRYVIWKDLNRRPEKGFRSSRILVWFPHVWFYKTREPRFERVSSALPCRR
ncbi:hypothetical protein B0H16DRAFT_1658200 [Mycena metata]|uniref:G domain-containing protein n=1 Tax=Mycena metata TaxID=1033252 RepID=A0AAD7KFV6_9AGAR|nr:hypothetical protein B0H16DRAFT_1658200 [Mycena metata]